jgi:hypothetical protein
MPVSSGKEEEAEAHSRGDDRPQSRTEGGHHQKWVKKNPGGRAKLDVSSLESETFWYHSGQDEETLRAQRPPE